MPCVTSARSACGPFPGCICRAVLRVDPGSVALISPREAGSLPWVVNKGVDHYAGAIIAIARENKLLVIDDSQLARRIHDEIAIDGDLSGNLVEALRHQLVRAGAAG